MAFLALSFFPFIGSGLSILQLANLHFNGLHNGDELSLLGRVACITEDEVASAISCLPIGAGCSVSILQNEQDLILGWATYLQMNLNGYRSTSERITYALGCPMDCSGKFEN